MARFVIPGSELSACLRDCREAARVCRETFDVCYQKTGLRQEPVFMSILAACGELLERCAAIIEEDHGGNEWLFRTCADLCRECATECENSNVETTLLIVCAQACDRAATQCEAMRRTLGKQRPQIAPTPSASVAVQS